MWGSLMPMLRVYDVLVLYSIHMHSRCARWIVTSSALSLRSCVSSTSACCYRELMTVLLRCGLWRCDAEVWRCSSVHTVLLQ